MFSKKVYNKQNGQIFIILNIITFIGFLLFIYTVFIATEPINVGDGLANVLSAFCILGFLGFPTALVAYSKDRQKYAQSSLVVENNKIYYMLSTYTGNTIIGPTTEEKYFDILKVNDYKITKRWIKIYGEIEQEIVYNDNPSSKKLVKSVKIARAFTNDKEVINLLDQQSLVKSNEISLTSPNTIKEEIKFSKDLILKLINDSVDKKIGCICEFMYNHRKHSIGVAYYNENEIIYFLDNQEFKELDEFLNEATIYDIKLSTINDEFIIKQLNSYTYKELIEIKEKQALI